MSVAFPSRNHRRVAILDSIDTELGHSIEDRIELQTMRQVQQC